MKRVRERLLLGLSILFCAGCGSGNPAAPQDSSATSGAGEVVLFTSLDPLFSEPIVADFETQTGIKVKLQTDTEAAKTVGLVNRLIARKAHPECDVSHRSSAVPSAANAPARPPQSYHFITARL